MNSANESKETVKEPLVTKKIVSIGIIFLICILSAILVDLSSLNTLKLQLDKRINFLKLLIHLSLTNIKQRIFFIKLIISKTHASRSLTSSDLEAP